VTGVSAPLATVDVLGVPFHVLTVENALAQLVAWLEEGESPMRVVATPNPEGVMQARRNPAFAAALQAADLCLADGTGIVWAARRLGTPLPHRVRGVDTIFALLQRLEDRQRPTTAYFLGGAPAVAERAAAHMQARFSHVTVVGHHHGFFSPEEEDTIRADIARTRPDILLVCTGMPRAELWATAHRHLPVRVALCLGGTLDIMAGTARMAPAWLRAIGLEWLYRLTRQPARWRRQLDIPRFVWAVLRKKG